MGEGAPRRGSGGGHPRPRPGARTVYSPRWTLGTNSSSQVGGPLARQYRTAQNIWNTWLRISGTHSVLACPHKPVTLDDQEPAGYFSERNVSSCRDFPCVFGKATLQRCVKRLSRVDDLSLPIESVYALFRRCHIFGEPVGRTCLELLDKLSGKGFVELEEEIVFVAHVTARW